MCIIAAFLAGLAIVLDILGLIASIGAACYILKDTLQIVLAVVCISTVMAATIVSGWVFLIIFFFSKSYFLHSRTHLPDLASLPKSRLGDAESESSISDIETGITSKKTSKIQPLMDQLQSTILSSEKITIVKKFARKAPHDLKIKKSEMDNLLKFFPDDADKLEVYDILERYIQKW